MQPPEATYESFLASKRELAVPVGFECANVSDRLFPFQRDIVRWACARGRAAIFADCGLGKTPMQLEWARQVHHHTGRRVLILAPLAVSSQTQREGEKFGIDVTACRSGTDVRDGINVTNYERLHLFDPESFGGIVLDESSILKGFDGTMRKQITDFARAIHYRLACTATPAPNDLIEITNHAEFLDVMSGKEILALFFKQDGNTTHAWRLKGHAREDFWRWMASWSVALRRPSDLGYSDEGFVLPPLEMHEVVVGAAPTSGELFAVHATSLADVRAAQRASLTARVRACFELVTNGTNQGAVEGVQPSLLREASREAQRAGTGVVPTEQGHDRSGRAQGLHAGILRGEPGQVATDSGTECSAQRPTKGALRSGRRAARTRQGADQEVLARQPTEERSAAPQEVRTDPSGEAFAAGETGTSVRDLRRIPDGQAEALSGDRPLPRDGCGSRHPLREVQQGAGSLPGQPGPTASSSTVPDDRTPWIIWCNLNAEQSALEAVFGDRAISVYGSLSADEKESRLAAWLNGERPILLCKPSIAGFGLNLQRCANVAFVGLSYSYEQFYQAIRRCWRFGQKKPVHAHLVIAENEGAVKQAIERKEKQSMEMMAEIVERMAGLQLEGQKRDVMEYREDIAEGDGWQVRLGDVVKRIRELDDNSVGLTVTSPPFPGMYAYTNSPHDIGNVKSLGEAIEHLRFLIPELLRVTMPGRSCCLHLTQAVAFKGTDGYIGVKDFRGAMIRAMEDAGWVYYGEVAIDKDPQVKAIRTKDRGLLFKSLATESAHMHMALADYLLQFRKPGENPRPIRAGISEKYGNPDGWITAEEWIEWAAPVWYRARPEYPGGIRETDVLQVAAARDDNDEKHLCPLQLGVIERAVKLWSAPGDLVIDPFNGIGSTGYVALKLNRRYAGFELKESYWRVALKNLERAVNEREQRDLFAGVA